MRNMYINIIIRSIKDLNPNYKNTYKSSFIVMTIREETIEEGYYINNNNIINQ